MRFNPAYMQRPRKRGNPEGRLQLQILKYLRVIGAYAGKTKTMGVKRGKVFCFDLYCFRGFPDITFFYQNKIGFIEVKSATGKISPEQQTFQNYCNNAGIKYILARNLDDVITAIN